LAVKGFATVESLEAGSDGADVTVDKVSGGQIWRMGNI
jgi:hypothetical protein